MHVPYNTKRVVLLSLAQYHRRPLFLRFRSLAACLCTLYLARGSLARLMLDGITSSSSGDITHIVMMVTTCVTLSLR